MKNWSITEDLTVLILTFNEEANIKRTLQALASWSGKVLVLDSFSTDSTVELAKSFAGVQVIQRQFTTFADQCNFGLENVQTEWVLSIDADYCFPKQASHMIQEAMNRPNPRYSVAFEYCIDGHPVHGGILPPRVVLFRTRDNSYVDDGHSHHLLSEDGAVRLPFKVRHDDRKPLTRWCASQVTYAAQEADKIAGKSFAALKLNDRIRKLILFAPAIVFVWVYFVRGGFLSGRYGLMYALQRLTAEIMLSLFLLDKILKRINS